MRRQAMLMTVGLLLGLLGAALVFAYVRSAGRGAADEGPMITTLVAQEAIAAGTPAMTIQEIVDPAEIPLRYAPEGAVADVAALEGLFATERIDPGETLLSSMFSTAGTTEAGRLAIPKGKEAIAVTTSLPGGLAQYLAPGDRVSVYATFRDTDRKITRKILTNVPILATEPAGGSATRQLSGSNPSELVLVLAATPDEAARLVFGKEVGSIWMTLVPQGQESPMVKPVTEGSIGKLKFRIRCTGDADSADCLVSGEEA